MSKQTAFYHAGTERKLQAVEGYLNSFLDVMTNQRGLETIYIDAFAGTGALPSDIDQPLLGEFLEADDLAIGSALRALTLRKKFSRYIFIEKSTAKVKELKSRVSELSLDNVRIDYIAGEANEVLSELCPLLSRGNVRSVVFLDPFGNQVSWELLESLAKTEHVDLWYLFPAMLGVYRQIGNSNNAKMTPEQEASLDALFGPHNWRDAFIREDVQRDLFGTVTTRSKVADVDAVTRFKIQCMKTIFKGCVLDEWLPLGRNNCHWYSLIFAMANPKPAAVKAGKAIAKHIMTRM